MRGLLRVGIFLALVASLILTTPALAVSNPVGTGGFQHTWARTDLPVSTLKVKRTWMWGPSADTPLLSEPYAEAPGGQRVVQYFDKSRMEITHPDGDPTSIWYVTNGLLAEELITGRLQLGDKSFEQHDPAPVNVAGDPNDPNGPTYATFNKLMGYAPIPTGWIITQTVDRAGHVAADPGLSSYKVTAKDVGAPTHHTVASVFWDFMTSTGLVYDAGQYGQSKLFENPFYATGYPLTEAYWTTVKVGGVNKRVLVQVFERRVLTYTPDNPDGWKVEAGNVGQHYYTWRYQVLDKTATPVANQVPPPSGTSCDPAYPDVCIPPPPPDLNCSNVPYRKFRVIPPDPHGFDSNHNGLGCESN